MTNQIEKVSVNLPGYRKIDIENWPRRDHYRYYTEKFKIQYNLTSDIKVDNLLKFCHSKGYRFYPVFIYLVSKVLNSIENFRMFRNRDGELCVWDYVIPNYTIFHDDDKTFSDCWSEYNDDFEKFYQTITYDMERFKDIKGIKARDGQPGNFYCISCVPWINFSCFSSRMTNG